MSRGINKAILVGNLAAEPEYRVLNNGENCVATVSLATNESFKDQQGNVQERTEWHRLVFWGKLADIAHQYLQKGSQIYVEGKIRTRSYDDQQTGERKYVTEIQVLDMQMLGSKPQGQGQSSAPAPQQQSQSWKGQQNQRQQWQPQQRQGNYQSQQKPPAQQPQQQPQQMPAPDAVSDDYNDPLPF